jgi:UDP-glucose 4-epimerase
MLKDFGRAFGIDHVIFRYFNVAGADPEGEIGEQHLPETHLIPLMLDAVAGKRPALTLFGTDYPTPDGTCVRDYVHVTDLAAAHVLGLRRLLDGKGGGIFCLGTGRGFSVREVIEASRMVTNREVPVIIGDRRPGDAASLVLSSTRAINELGWDPQHSTLRQMIGDAWAWAQKPGFKG